MLTLGCSVNTPTFPRPSSDATPTQLRHKKNCTFAYVERTNLLTPRAQDVRTYVQSLYNLLEMKLSGFTGTGTGKLGASVFAVSGGQQIVRQYQSQVANPSTTGQVGQRSKMKLMAQLAAVFATVIAIPKDGMVSARNRFISKNIGLCSESDGTATINLAGVQLTISSRGIPAVAASRNGAAIEVSLASDATKVADRVVYCAFVRNADGTIQLLDTTVASAAGNDGNFPASIAGSNAEVVVYAYGIKDADAAASGLFGNYNVASGTDVASLVATRSISTADFAFTKTVGLLLTAI